MNTLQSGLAKFSQFYTTGRDRPRRQRWVIFTLVALVALLLATVVVAQASQNFAISCGYVIDGGGGAIASANFGVVAALGNPIVPPNDGSAAPSYAVRSANFGLRAGFLPNTTTTVASASTASISPDATLTSTITRMPFIANMIGFVIGSCVPLAQARW
jgi:hypothetical protein